MKISEYTTTTLFESYKIAKQKFSAEEQDYPELVDKYLKIFKELVSQNKISSEYKDIGYWIPRGWDAFHNFIVHAMSAPDMSKKMFDRRVKVSSDQILTIKKTENMHLFMPLSKGASCFHGIKGNENTETGGWCISTVNGKNYFYDYVVDRGLYVFFLIYENEVYCLVVNNDFEVIESQDKLNNNKFPSTKFLQYAQTTREELESFVEDNRKIIQYKINSHYKEDMKYEIIRSLKSGDFAEVSRLYHQYEEDIKFKEWIRKEMVLKMVQEVKRNTSATIQMFPSYIMIAEHINALEEFGESLKLHAHEIDFTHIATNILLHRSTRDQMALGTLAHKGNLGVKYINDIMKLANSLTEFPEHLTRIAYLVHYDKQAVLTIYGMVKNYLDKHQSEAYDAFEKIPEEHQDNPRSPEWKEFKEKIKRCASISSITSDILVFRGGTYALPEAKHIEMIFDAFNDFVDSAVERITA